MSQQSIHGSGPRDDSQDIAADQGGQVSINTSSSDAILDEIDSVLEENAEAFVRSFVQKGGE